MTNNTTPANASGGDPELTAFALGELEPGSDAYKQVQALLDTDADARAYVEQTRALGEQLTASYHGSDAAASGLSDHQQEELSAMIDQHDREAPAPTTPPKRFWLSRPALIAAGLALAAGAAITAISLMDGPDTPTTRHADTDTITGLDKVGESLAAPVAVDFENAPLAEVFAFLNKQTQVAFDTDWDALAKRGVDAKTPVSLKADELVPAGRVLTAALQAAWSQSQHPDPAQWTMTEAGVTVAPQSALVEARLAATAALLNSDRLSTAPLDKRVLAADRAEVWESGLWNQMLAKRAEAAEHVLAEAGMSLVLAESAAKTHDFDAATEHGRYAYQLLASHGPVLKGDQFDAPLQRIGKLQDTVYTGRLAQDKAAIAKAVEAAKANDTELGAYESAMLAAVEALDNQSFQAANEAITQAGTHLIEKRAEYEPERFHELAGRAARLHAEIQRAQREYGTEQLTELEKQQQAVGLSQASDEEKRQAQATAERLAEARLLLERGAYGRAVTELDVALKAQPNNQAIIDLRVLLSTSNLPTSNADGENTALRRGSFHTEFETLGRQFRDLQAQANTYDGFGADRLEQKIKSLVVLNDGQRLHDQSGLTPSQAGNDGLPRFSLGSDFITDSGLGAQPGPDAYFRRSVRTDWDAAAAKGGLSLYGGAVLKEQHWGFQPAAKPPPLPSMVAFDAPASGRPLRQTGMTVSETDRERVRFERELGERLQLALPQEGKTRQGRYDDLISRYSESINGREPTDGDRKHIESLKAGRARVAMTEPLERNRIEAMKELRDLEKRFFDESLPALQADPEMSRDAFALVNDNPFYNPADAGRAMSTFSVDVDTAAYTIARRQLMQRNRLPVPGAVRIEEMINYFDYNYKAPVVDTGALEDGVVTQASLEAFEKKQEGFAPFATHLQVTDCPWTEGNQLVRIGIKGMEVAQEDRPSAHLTFLLDVSGSMNRPNKLGLVKDSLKLLLDKLNEDDHVSIVVYAGASGIVLENTPATNRAQIEQALNKLRAGGSTAGAAGIRLAYQTAQKHYIDGGVNRVILCTDGDFNVGISGTDDLVDLIKSKANPEADEDGNRRGVYLSVMAYGMGNLNDAMMEPLTNAGNGNYAYIDTLREATKVMYDQAGASLVTIAKDVKVQVHFDASQVMAYRLIGYENRVLANEDFDNDKVDAGDIGAGHSVTALYEIVPFPDDGGLGNEGFFEVKHRIEELEEAVALNHTLMQTASLTPKQSMKLAASTRMLEQEVMLAGALAEKLDKKKPINAEADVDAAPAAPGDIAHEAASKERFDDGAMMSVKLRYKPVDAPAEDGTSRLITSRIFADELVPFAAADDSTRFAASVASFAMQLRSSPHAGDVDLDWVHDIAKSSSNHDPSQLKAEMLELVKKAKGLMPEKVKEEAPGVDGGV
ncbi:MAG: von Willebrand factor type A domain-containing protein [Phycisphaeraceae bacterium]|nr:von Willebrand factor type A domain-containing protein [Phycisphaeraceae bacterium]